MVFHGNNDCFVHLVAYDLTRTGFSQISLFHFYSPFNHSGKEADIRLSSSLCDHRLDTCDIFSYFFDSACIVQLVCGILESQVEEFLLSSY